MLKPRSTYLEWFIDILKYIMPPANVNAHSLDIIIDICIPRSVKEGTRRKRSTNPGPNFYVLGLHQKMSEADSWERFLSNDDKKEPFALFVKILESPESEEYVKYIG